MRLPVLETPSSAKDSTGPSSRLVPAIVCACVTLFFYLLLPGVLEQISSSEPSHAVEMFPWVKPVTRQMLDARQDVSGHLRSAVQFGVCCAGLFAAYLFMLRMAGYDRSLGMQRFVVWSGAAFLAVNLTAPVTLTTDLYAYAFYGRLVSVYHMDAYADAIPASLSLDPLLVLWGQSYGGSAYGPLWTLISACLARLGGENAGLVVLLFRGVSAAAILTGTGLICAILRRISPGRVTQGMVFFLWNPLVVIEFSMSGHNDAVMVMLLLLGIWLHVKGHKTGAVVALLLSALVKFVTGPLILLYIWMVLRPLQSQRERAWFLARCILCSGAVMWAVFFMAHVRVGAPIGRVAGSTEFYANNFHELIFNGLRRLLGEDAESVKVPLEFQSWWFTAGQSGTLYAGPESTAEVLGHVEKGRKLLVIAPYTDERVRVFDPVLRRKGFVSNDLKEEVNNDSGELDDDPYIAQLEKPPKEWPTVIKANLWIRTGCWTLFALFGLLAAWRTTSFDRFLTWSGAVMLAMYFLITTRFWPWYLIWALALGALKPANLPAKLALLMSASVLTLYLTMDYSSLDYDWIYNIRSIPAVVLPAVVFMVVVLCRKRKNDEYSSNPDGTHASHH
jgi:hypothetical protein